MRLFLILILTGFLSLNFFTEKGISEKERSGIENLLKKQVEAWNEGNLEKIMQTYWNSESGHFTLVVQKIKNKWLIVSDHSSSSN